MTSITSLARTRPYDTGVSSQGIGTVRRILVVDDVPMVRAVLVGYL